MTHLEKVAAIGFGVRLNKKQAAEDAHAIAGLRAEIERWQEVAFRGAGQMSPEGLDNALRASVPRTDLEAAEARAEAAEARGACDACAGSGGGDGCMCGGSGKAADAVVYLRSNLLAAEAKLAEAEQDANLIQREMLHKHALWEAAEARAERAERQAKALAKALEEKIAKWDAQAYELHGDSNPQGVFQADKYRALLECADDVRDLLAAYREGK